MTWHSHHWLFYRNKMARTCDDKQEQSLLTSDFHANLYGAVNSQSHDQENMETQSEKMRARLKWHYMNSYEKYKAGGRKPWKLVVQIIKIFLVTAQIWWFGELRFSVVTYLDETHHVFDGLLFRNNGSTFYTRQSLYNQINYTTSQYENIEHIALGAYARPCDNPADCPVVLCKHSYHNSTIVPSQFRYQFLNENPDVEIMCTNITTSETENISEFVELHKYNVDAVILILHLQTIKIGQLKLGSNPECVRFKIQMKFKNQRNTGKFKYKMGLTQHYLGCNVSRDSKDELRSGEVIYDLIVIFFCFWSFVLTSRSLYKNFKLAKVTFKFFKVYKKEKLSVISDGLELVNAWFIIILLTDILTISGSIIKIYIDMKNLKETHFYDMCSLCLGISVLFIWIGILRYLGFLKKYNVLLITIEAAMPSVLRFLSCAGILYFGFLFCGWIVIGPYHPKFTTLSEVSECLFSLVNGDDMFPTFREMSRDNYELWVFSKIYLYLFISLFIYIVLSLFIGIISDTYERLKFSTLPEVSECLFSLVNGDDMFVTFREMSQDNYELWVFSKIYLYLFISLFIYIVLSLFIGIISDTYERLKSGEHILCSNVRRFIHGPECRCFTRSEMIESSEGPRPRLNTPETPSNPSNP